METTPLHQKAALKTDNASAVSPEFTRIKKNFSLLFGAEIVARVLMLILTIVLAQKYSPEKLGIYTLALSVGNLFEIMGNMGLGTVFIQRVAGKKENLEKELATFLPLRILLNLMSFGLLVITAMLLQKDAETFTSLLLGGLFYHLLSITMLFWAAFDSMQKMGYSAVGKLCIYPVVFLAGLIVIHQGLPVNNLFWGYVAGIVLALLVSMIAIQKSFCKIRITWDIKKWLVILRSGWSIGLGSTFVLVYTYLDTIIISATMGETWVGLYQAGYKIIGTIFILTTIISQTYLPPLVEAKNSPEKQKTILKKALTSSFFWSMPIAMGGLILAERIILFIYGTAYTQSVPTFKILIINCLIFFVSSVMINFLYSMEKQRKVAAVFFVGALINTIANLLIIPRWGIEGAAATTIAAELIVLIATIRIAKKTVPIPLLQTSWLSLIASLIMAAALFTIHLESLFLQISLGAAVYFGIYFTLPRLISSFRT